MAYGDHLKASRDGYHHDGLDCGDGTVVHYAAEPGGSKTTACVRISSMDEFAGGGGVSVQKYANYDREAAMSRAMSRLGESEYDLAVNNCEHFARWCITGEHRSEQVTTVISTGAVVGIPASAASIGKGLVAGLGYSGVSGPGLMSGLATAGKSVGGGVVEGMLVMAAVPAVCSVAFVSGYALKDSAALPEVERQARGAGRVGSVVGVGVGAVGSILAVSALGVPGLSEAGISSGLAVIGSLVGGGMRHGVMAVIAAPALFALAVGFGVYLLWKWLAKPTSPDPTLAF
jgi:hypothetical protein